MPGDEDELLIRADKTPNSHGRDGRRRRRCRARAPRSRASSRGIHEGQIKALYVVDDNIAADPDVAAALPRLDFLVVHCLERERDHADCGHRPCRASTFAERNGTFTNFQGRVQRIRPSVATLDQRSLAGRVCDEPSGQIRDAVRPVGTEARSAMPARPGGSSPASRRSWGCKYKYTTAEDVFNELASHGRGVQRDDVPASSATRGCRSRRPKTAARTSPDPASQGTSAMEFLLISLIKIVLVLLVILTTVANLVYVERQDQRVHPEPDRPEPGRARGDCCRPRRRAEAVHQGRHRPGQARTSSSIRSLRSSRSPLR